MRRGVTQGCPLSPTVLNLCQDFFLKQIADADVFSIHGFKIHQNVENIAIVGFVDDTTIIAKNLASATTLVNIVKDLFSTVGMQINPIKSTIINVEEGQLVPKSLALLENSVIPPVEGSICIKYLGVNFNDEIVFDRKSFLSQLEKDFRNLVTSPLLRGDQKLNILDQ